MIEQLAARFPVILGFGINRENVIELVETTGIKGLALQGGDEIRPGYREFDDLADMLELLEVD